MTIPSWLTNEYPFKPNSFKIADGLQINYVDEGESEETMLMVHGNPTWSYFYRNVIKAFANDFRTIAVDNIGCGLSDKPQNYDYTLENHIDNLEKLVLSLKVKNITLVVHDWGGAIGHGFAGRHPELIKRIVVMNTSAFFFPTIPFRISLCRLPLLGALAVRGFNAFAGAATTMAVSKPLTKDIKRGFVFPYSNWHDRIATHKFVLDIPMSEAHPTRKVLDQVEADLEKLKDKPLLICWGMDDFCFHPGFLERWQELRPDAEVHKLENCNHYLLEDETEKVLGLIKDFTENK